MGVVSISEMTNWNGCEPIAMVGVPDVYSLNGGSHRKSNMVLIMG